MARFRVILKSTVRVCADYIWPPMCAACETPIRDVQGLCARCWDAVTFLSGPACEACGVPFEYDLGPGALCGDCTKARPPFQRARAAFIYDDASRPIILAFKHADRTDLAPVLATWLRRPAAALLADADIIAPVPLHWTRLLSRRFNQAALLSNRLARLSGTKPLPDLLVRRKRTGTQGGKSRRARQRNVQGAFKVPARHRAQLRDKRVLLVDDVMTTGATLDATARALLRGGASAVDVVTLARVVLNQP